MLSTDDKQRIAREALARDPDTDLIRLFAQVEHDGTERTPERAMGGFTALEGRCYTGKQAIESTIRHLRRTGAKTARVRCYEDR